MRWLLRLVVNAAARRAFEIRHAVISSFRRTLQSRGFVEVETPVLHPEAGGARPKDLKLRCSC